MVRVTKQSKQMFYNIQHITNILMVLLMVAIVDDVTL